MKRSVEIKNQMKFCSELMNRLEKEIVDDLEESYIDDVVFKSGGITNYTRRKADIVRLRRELLNLLKLIVMDWSRDNK